MKTIKYYILFMLAIIGGMHTLSAQTEDNSVVYTYDLAGNRTNRSLEVTKMKQLDSLIKTNTNTTNSEVLTSNTAEQLTETIENKQITIFPNPTEGILQINITNLELKDKGEIKISGVNGAELMKLKSLKSKNTINISDKPNGVYMMEVMLNGKKSVWKIVKK